MTLEVDPTLSTLVSGKSSISTCTHRYVQRDISTCTYRYTFRDAYIKDIYTGYTYK